MPINQTLPSPFIVRLMVLNDTFNDESVISWWSVLLVEETGENHRLIGSHWQSLSHRVVSSGIRIYYFSTDYTGSCKYTIRSRPPRPFPIFTLSVEFISKFKACLIFDQREDTVIWKNWCHLMMPGLSVLQNNSVLLSECDFNRLCIERNRS